MTFKKYDANKLTRKGSLGTTWVYFNMNWALGDIKELLISIEVTP